MCVIESERPIFYQNDGKYIKLPLHCVSPARLKKAWVNSSLFPKLAASSGGICGIVGLGTCSPSKTLFQENSARILDKMRGNIYDNALDFMGL